ncbi:STAS domain-containing protein [Bacterioplanoides sp. SCSIO 12839]|uniref:STAS domain-containing protein n=1 Tax=Bacterioplanoides sp. SCSIO 12839 TaxID=2829569 RepID=UPI0021046AF5|nr:STAS domain-containing protein [Bacterioplanoides sp. SCSIO 12839]UTW46883.1 STAS domain-containing protein [Bacterioplanoides sp. SCSIO 12839]
MSFVSYVCNEDQVISLSGDFDVSSVGSVRNLFEDLAVNGSDVIVDLSEVRFIDSSGIGALVFLYKRLVAQQHQMVLIGVQGQPKELLDILKITNTIPVFESLSNYLSDKNSSAAVVH